VALIWCIKTEKGEFWSVKIEKASFFAIFGCGKLDFNTMCYVLD
jgi:hypothetical protein